MLTTPYYSKYLQLALFQYFHLQKHHTSGIMVYLYITACLLLSLIPVAEPAGRKGGALHEDLAQPIYQHQIEKINARRPNTT
jgi:hypothetical protein